MGAANAKRFERVALVWVSLLLVPAAALAQVGIAGQVKDTTGAVLPGVMVEASSPVLIEKVRTVVTDGQGLYNVVNLVAGAYTVTFSLPGFITVRREGLVLAGTFTATVNVEMRLGAVEETITVSGATPVVDVQNVMQNQVTTKATMDALPTGKTFQNFAAVIPGLTIAPVAKLTGQDVGGSQSQGSHSLMIHGSRAGDMNNMIEGIPNNNANGLGNGGIYFDPGSMQEFNYQLGSTSAEVQTGGVHVNLIAKDGGNRFLGSFFGAYTNNSLQFDNITDALRARGVSKVSETQRIWDFNPSFGGPLRRDKLWFYVSARHWGANELVANGYYNKSPGGLTYTPDLSRPAVDDNFMKSVSVRPTWQITRRNKLTGYVVPYFTRCTCHLQTSSIRPPEVATRAISEPNFPFTFGSVSWTAPITNRLLFEAGMSRLLYDYVVYAQNEVTPGAIPAIEVSTGRWLRAPAVDLGTTTHGPISQWKATVAYVTGSHAFKTGFTLQKNQRENDLRRTGDMVLQLLNGVPSSVVLYTTPLVRSERLFPMLGVFAQDQWTRQQLTVTMGLRFDYHNAHVPAQYMDAVQFVGVRDFAKVSNVPNWKDLSPRLGASYDLFGNGKTALKVAVNRYVNGELFGGITQNVNPVLTSVNSATRAWRDANGDFVPQDDELGPLSNTSFGQVVVRTRFDDDYREGFGKRGYNWETMVGVQHELVPQVAVNVSYHRRSYGNFLATDNLSTAPSDYDPFCVTVPSDARLPGGGGNQLCGFYDVKPAKFGQVNELVSLGKDFGKETDVYNGVDLTMSARLPRSAYVSGGLNIGRQETNNCDVVLSRPDLTFAGSASGVLASRTQAFCNVEPPFQTQVKLQGVYPLPWWDLQTSATFQSIAGPQILATYTVRNADIAPSLGRNLSAGAAGSVRVDLVPPGTMYDTRLYQADLRVSKIMRFERYRIQGNFDLYNLFNASPVLARNDTYGPAWGQPLSVLLGRLFKFGVQVDF